MGAKDTLKHYDEEHLHRPVCLCLDWAALIFVLTKLECAREALHELGIGEWCFRSSPTTLAQKAWMRRSPGSAHLHLLSAAMLCLTVVWRPTWCITEIPLTCISSFACYLQNHSRHRSNFPEGLEEQQWSYLKLVQLAWYFNVGCAVGIWTKAQAILYSFLLISSLKGDL